MLCTSTVMAGGGGAAAAAAAASSMGITKSNVEKIVPSHQLGVYRDNIVKKKASKPKTRKGDVPFTRLLQ